MTRLQPLGILVTRPSPYNEKLCQELCAYGYQAIALPVIIINKWLPASTIKQLRCLNNYNWAVFVSQAAVCYGLAAATPYWPYFPPQLKLAAIGAATATALAQAGYHQVLYPPQWSSEGLLALPQFQQLAPQKIAIFCGRNTNKLLATTLRTRGAQVSLLPVYQRRVAVIDSAAYQYLLANNLINVIMATSIEIVAGLQQLFAATPAIKSLPLLVSSKRIMLAATAQGFNNCILIADASLNSILKGLQQLAS